MAATFIAAVGNNSASASTLDASASLNVAAGDLLVAWVKHEGTATTNAIAKDSGTPTNAFTFDAGDEIEHTNGDLNGWFGYKLSAEADSSFTPRLTLGASRGYVAFIVLQFRPDSGETFTKDASNTNEGANSTVASGTITTTGTDEVVIGAYGPYTSTTTEGEQIGGSAATEPTGSPQDNASVWYRILTATMTNGEATSSNGPAAAWVSAIISFKSETASTTDQEGFRFGADDGSESAHTWLENQDTNRTQTLASPLLLRLLLDATGDPSSVAYTLRAQKNGTGGYAAVNVGATETVTLDYTVSAGADDAQQSGTTMTVTGVTIGASLDATTEYVGLRFQSVQIPQGATISAAYLSVVPSGTGEDEPLVTITGFDEDNTAAFTTTASDITNRSVTTASVSWDSANLGATGATYHDTPSLVSVVQEIVDRGGWSSGNAMGFRIQGGATTTRDLTIESYENTGANPPKLHIEYTRPAELYIATSANITAGGEATTARLTAPSGKTTSDFVTGRRWDDENGSDSIDITADDYTEVEWSLNTQSPAQNGDYWDFRVYAGSTALTSYGVTPRLTLGAQSLLLPQSLFARVPALRRF